MTFHAHKCACLGLVLFFAAFAKAQSPGVILGGTFENYYVANGQSRGAQHRITWMQVTADLNANLRLVASNQQRINANALDETYAQYESKGTIYRAGVMRSAFGFSDWAEQYYTGIIAFPMVRSSYVADEFSLLRLDSGVQVSGGSPTLQYQVGLVDIEREARQFFPNQMDHAVARLQTSTGPLIIGLSGLAKANGADPNRLRAYGLDVRWTAPQIQLRAEADKVDSDDSTSKGYYIDAFYRPGHETKMRFVARAESFEAPYKGATAIRYITGVRQVLNDYFTVSVNYGWGNHISPASSNTGWSAQLMSSVHF